MLVVAYALVALAFATTIITAAGKCPVWVPLMCLVALEALHYFPK